MRKTILLIFIVNLFTEVCGQSDFSNWPAGTSPQEIGQRVSKRFIESPHPRYAMDGIKHHIAYFEACTWYGALTFAKEIKDEGLKKDLIQRFSPLWNDESNLLPDPTHVDYNVFGIVPFELYLQTKDKKYFDLGLHYADNQWMLPDSNLTSLAKDYHKNGLTWQTRLWIDDMYMITMIQAQAYRATGERKYMDRAAKEMVFYLDKLQRPNGLFYHADDTPFFWGRGNGWMAAGMAELLRALPEDNPDRPKIMIEYKTMMSSLLKYQSKDGMWRQLIDDADSWPETSSTGMFTFAMVTGVKNGWLEKETYGNAARKGWLALITYINDDGDLREVCEGTGKKNDHQYYLDRKRNVGDFHGQAPLLWCATALLR